MPHKPQRGDKVEKRYLTTAEVAQELRVSTDTVLRLIDRGELPALRVSDRLYRIPVPAFARFKRGPVARRPVVHREATDMHDYGAGEDVGEEASKAVTPA
jgi:excisionase family DNA binding protein